MEMLNQGHLTNDWLCEGKRISDFFKTLTELQSVRSVERVFIGDLFYGRAEKREDSSDIVRFYTPGKHTGKVFSKDEMIAEGFERLYNEFACGDFVWDGSTAPYKLLRPKATQELISALGLSGIATKKSSPGRNAYIAELLRNAPDKRVSLILHEEEGRKKVLSIRSGKYTPINLNELEDVYNAILDADMGSIKCIGWHVDHDYATIDLIFPDATAEFKELCGIRDDINAGIRLQTSGTGYCCFTAKEIWQVGSVISEHAFVKRKHIGEWNPQKFLEDVKTNIFDEYGALPERLCDLFNIVLVNDETASRCEMIMSKCITSLFKHLNFTQIFKIKEDDESEYRKDRKNHAKEICDKLTDRFVCQVMLARAEGKPVEITAYDLAIAVMEIPGTISDIPDAYLEPLANACGKAAYFPFKEGTEYISGKKPEKSDITFVA